ncbi:MAG: hypothetical protein JEZ06_20705 [Anaerolineaceae bacterium]|nr:hypothetical protein [Anaerolineaceae bacterium]
MRKLSEVKIRASFFVFAIIILSLACHLPGAGWWVDVNDSGDIVIDTDPDYDPIGDEVNGEKNNISAGTYIYEMYVNDEPPPGGDDWDYELESEFNIKVANDGKVTGFKIYRLWVDSVNITGCVTRSEEGFTTDFSGFLEGNQGPARLENRHWNFWEYHGEECGDGKKFFKDEEDVYDAIITISGNQMEISYQGKVLYNLTKE